jgi:hypothetical protein
MPRAVERPLQRKESIPMPYLLVRSKVQDFDAWKTAYDGHAPARAQAGLTEVQLLRSVADPNDVVILFEADDVSRARAFVGSDDLKQAMQAAGVIGTPEFLELEQAERGRPAAP